MSEPSTLWLSKRNCSASPRQLALVLSSLVAISFGFGLAFAAQGLWMVLPFCGLELAAVATAFVCYGRHATDFERVSVTGSALTVERIEADRRATWQFELPWTRVETHRERSMRGERRRVFIASRDLRVEIGRYVLEHRRGGMAQEVAIALRAAQERRSVNVEEGNARMLAANR